VWLLHVYSEWLTGDATWSIQVCTVVGLTRDTISQYCRISCPKVQQSLALYFHPTKLISRQWQVPGLHTCCYWASLIFTCALAQSSHPRCSCSWLSLSCSTYTPINECGVLSYPVLWTCFPIPIVTICSLCVSHFSRISLSNPMHRSNMVRCMDPIWCTYSVWSGPIQSNLR
jgi:hypothetical protein